VRTDRRHPFFAGPASSPAAPTAVTATLRSVLLTYTLFNWDLGYCQGMSDLLAPVLFVMRDEADAFWCFQVRRRSLPHLPLELARCELHRPLAAALPSYPPHAALGSSTTVSSL
jgi:hypothetical protein